MKRPFTKAGFFTFMRAQFSSQISSLFDFAVTILGAKLLDIYYVYATSLGSVAGGILNYRGKYIDKSPSPKLK